MNEKLKGELKNFGTFKLLNLFMRAIIIDDERLARAELRKLLQDFPEIEVVDEAPNAEEGIQKIFCRIRVRVKLKC